MMRCRLFTDIKPYSNLSDYDKFLKGQDMGMKFYCKNCGWFENRATFREFIVFNILVLFSIFVCYFWGFYQWGVLILCVLFTITISVNFIVFLIIFSIYDEIYIHFIMYNNNEKEITKNFPTCPKCKEKASQMVHTNP